MITADNVYYHASFVDDSFSVSGHTMVVGTGGSNFEKLLEVPIKKLSDRDSVRITVAVEALTIHRDPHVGLSDGVNYNRIELRDDSNRCALNSGTNDSPPLVPNAAVPNHYTLIFTPFFRYGACHTSVNGTYVNTGRFNVQLDVNRPLSFVVYRENTNEDYLFKYFVIEVLKND